MADTTVPLEEIYFPSVTICNINQVVEPRSTAWQVRLSMLEQADLGGNQQSSMAKYLINYFLLGKELGEEPDNWTSKLEEIQKKLNWDPKKQTFANLSSQVGWCKTVGPGHYDLGL